MQIKSVSWITTVIGCVGAVATALVPLFKTGDVDLQTLVSAAAFALLGWFSKDWNVSGSGQQEKGPEGKQAEARE